VPDSDTAENSLIINVLNQQSPFLGPESRTLLIPASDFLDSVPPFGPGDRGVRAERHKKCGRRERAVDVEEACPEDRTGAKVGVCSVAGDEEPELVALREEISCRVTAAHLPPERPLPRSAPTARATAAAPTSVPLLGLARGWARILSRKRTMGHADPTKRWKGKPTARRSSYPSGPPSRRNGIIPPITLIS
jgi:hypothetical protein